MLYERWLEVAGERPHELALHDQASDQRWTFGQLARMTLPEPDGPVVYPRGSGPEFLRDLLAAWKHRRVVCPLESAQPIPEIPPLPWSQGHCKTTSATTGQSRLIAFRQEQLQADADQIVATMGLRPDWPNLGVLSLAHSYGFSNLALPLFLHGIPLVLLGSPLPEGVRQAVRRWKTVTLPAVPAMWRVWHEAKVLEDGIRLGITAGAPMPLSLETSIYRETGVKVHNFYGASECGGIAYDRTALPRRDAACVGTALDGVRLEVDARGCLEVRGPAVGETYWPESDAVLAAGRFRTSDLAELVDGEVMMRGRVSDLINVAGRKLSPETVEQVLLRHPAVRDGLVFGVSARECERGDRVVACVELKDQVTDQELRAFLLDHLPAWQVPREWWRVPNLGVNERGKRSRKAWRDRFCARTAAGGDDSESL